MDEDEFLRRLKRAFLSAIEGEAMVQEEHIRSEALYMLAEVVRRLPDTLSDGMADYWDAE